MLRWVHVVIEGYCFAEDNPCGYNGISYRCLENGHCPHFAYAESNERDASFFVPLHLIIFDRIKGIYDEINHKVRWYSWGKWFYDKDWYKKIPVVKCSEWEERLKKAEDEFPEWYAKREMNEEKN